ncbi:4a-hydroxytetrahydrobiopterin dehydratase [Pseudomonas saliphila]|uniref:4a-hydroxytetrahydrobiopterin dehydratase n=1 Tax=Pseudomonas saliphila TaxID=2586906 RepID=UPI00123AFE82|nr:4a-hydroxytetrahydrobiopterin dehydratase [Pseudomonas saliphila]
MSTLAEESLASGDKNVLDDAALKSLLANLEGWTLNQAPDVPRIEKVFKFPDFASALAFTNRVGELAEQENHHPALLTEWGKVTVSWWTHSQGGVLRNDVIMAARTDRLKEG